MAKEKGLECIVVIPERLSPKNLPKGIPKKWLHTIKPKKFLLHGALKKWYWERVQVPQFFAQEKLDWEYYPYPCPLPEKSPHRRAMTVHDLILWKDPRYKGNRLKRYYHRQARRSLVFMDLLFTVSAAIHKELGIPAAKVLPNAIPEMPKNIPANRDSKEALVYLGGYDIRKNVPQMVETVAGLKHPPRLMLIGTALHRSKLYPEVPEYPYTYFLGALPDEEVYSALKSAKAFLHFSDSEGFNIPLLQAMSIGIPAIVRDTPVNREISNDSALFLPKSESLDSLKEGLSDTLMLLEDPARRKSVVAAQKKAAARFSWKKSLNIFLSQLKSHEE
ncbi:MAG: glycosyltransferase [Candidatus Gracilibacteria bacterium]